MKRKTKLIAMFMSLCLVCAVFAIGVFALKTANLKIGGDVSFQATGVEAHIKNASVSGAVTTTTLAANDAEGEVINTSMTQADIDTTFQNWQTLKLDFDENATDIELKFNIANTSTNTDNYIEIDYTYSFNNANPNVDVFPGDENAQSVWENNEYILAPKGAAETATYETFTLKFKVLDKELNVPENTKVSVTIALKNVQPQNISSTDDYTNAIGTQYTNVYKDETLLYSLSSQPNVASVVGYIGSPSNIIVPAVVKVSNQNYVVNKLGEAVFAEVTITETSVLVSSITNIVLPNSISYVGTGAFVGTGITHMDLPESVVEFGVGETIFGEGMTFAYCHNLMTIKLSPTITSIGDATFLECKNLTRIHIPCSVLSFGESAFAYCEKLDSIEIPYGVASIGLGAFWGCPLTQISVHPLNSVFDSRENCNAIIETSTNTLLVGSSNTTFPSSVTKIAFFSFCDNQALTSIEIPNTVKEIGVPVGSEDPDSFGYVFNGCKNLRSVVLPEGITDIYMETFFCCENLISVNIPSTILYIKGSSFYYCKKLNNITIPSSTIDILEHAFEGCNGLNTIYIDSQNVTSKLTSQSAQGCLLNNATSVYIKSGLDVTAATYLTNTANFTPEKVGNAVADADGDGYILYTKN